MRIVLIGLATLTIILPASIELASAQQPRPWCLQAGRGGPGGGLPDCSYYTLQQCRAADRRRHRRLLAESRVGLGPDRRQALQAGAEHDRARLLRACGGAGAWRPSDVLKT